MPAESVGDINAGANENGFKELWSQLRHRTRAPIQHVVFWVHLIIGVLLFGGLAVWLELWLYFRETGDIDAGSLRTALLTYFPAFIGSTSIQLMFEENRDKRMLAFAIFVLIVFSIIAGWLIFDKSISGFIAFPLCVGCSMFAVWLWWVANGLNPAFRDKVDPDAPLGGVPTAAPKGSLDGFQH